MFKLLKDFGKSFKDYIDHVMKVSFGELVFHFFELLIIIFISLFTYVPMYLLQDVGLNILRLGGNEINETVLHVYNLTFSIVEILIALFAFIYLFNKRYEDLKNEEKQDKSKKQTEKVKGKKDANMDLPKMKDE
jgi:hypothetical protein